MDNCKKRYGRLKEGEIYFMDRRRMLAAIGIAIVAVVVVIGVILLANASSPGTNPAPAKPNAGQQATQNKPAQQTPASPGSSGSSSADSGAGASSSGGSLANSGPGDTIAVFLAASALGYIIFLRRQLRANE